MVKTRFPRIGRIDRDSDRLLSLFWQLWRKERGDVPPSPRDTLYLFGLMLNLADADAASPDGSLFQEGEPPPANPTRKHLEAAFQQLFAKTG
jgi:hypothetical protein